MKMEKQKIVVIGAGVVGLSTAVCVQELLPFAEITLLADKFEKDTLSDGAPGIFCTPITVHPDKEKVTKWHNDSLKHYLEIAPTREAGVRIISGFCVFSTKRSEPSQVLPLKPEKPLEVEKEMTPAQLSNYPAKYKYGYTYSTVITDCRHYLPWLLKRFRQKRGKVESRHVKCLSELSDEFNLIINCAGLGAKQLMNDPYLTPIRGQITRVKAPWIKNFYYGDNIYISPGIDYVTLGGIKDYGSWSTEVNTYQKKYIWDECVKLVPSLGKAEVLEDWVGLRPHRPSICLDSGIVQTNGKMIKVVNNYGHGSSGVSLSWGTGIEAAALAKEALQNKFFFSKL